jgi:hypothetical protein
VIVTYTLDRIVKNPGFTLGRLKTTLRNFWVMEDAVREIPGEPVEKWKVKGQTAIPYGTYEVIVSFSQRFQKMLPQLVNVPGFSGIRVHAGNTAADTEGCLLLGLGLSEGENKIVNSRAAMIDFMDELEGVLDGGAQVFIEVK